MEMAQSTAVDKFSNETKHHLSDKWVLWAHLPHDTDWTLKSYINIVEFETVEEVIAVINTIPQTMIKNCMLFVMKEGINPTWEDKRNCKGGCFSFKIMNKQCYFNLTKWIQTTDVSSICVNPSHFLLHHSLYKAQSSPTELRVKTNKFS